MNVEMTSSLENNVTVKKTSSYVEKRIRADRLSVIQLRFRRRVYFLTFIAWKNQPYFNTTHNKSTSII